MLEDKGQLRNVSGRACGTNFYSPVVQRDVDFRLPRFIDREPSGQGMCMTLVLADAFGSWNATSNNGILSSMFRARERAARR